MEIREYISPSSHLTDELHSRLVEAGQTLGDDEIGTFLLAVQSEEGVILAGCKGEIAFTSLHVLELWVSDDLRGNGIGTALLKKAEVLGIAKGCDRIHIETRSNAARGLYEKLGYRVFGELENYEGSNSFYYLEKPLE